MSKTPWNDLLDEKYKNNPSIENVDSGDGCLLCDRQLICGVVYEYEFKEPYPYSKVQHSPIYGRINQKPRFCPLCGKKI